ncbi:MAG: hypothetical protein AB8H79_24390 [Myxococcota bacterium]
MWVKWLALPGQEKWTRVKAHRAEPLSPGGRCRLSLFESVDGGRPHPRMQISLPPADDASGVRPALDRSSTPRNAAAFEAELRAQLTANADALSALDAPTPTGDSARFQTASVRGQRHAVFFDQARDWLAELSKDWPRKQKNRAEYAIEEIYAGTLQGPHLFDDANTGTYHSYGKDKPFVHVLEAVLSTVPEPGTEAFARLPAEQQSAVRAQRRQCQAHLDDVMRRKYAYTGVNERDIERSVGGRLIDRRWRQVVTSTLPSGSLVPELWLYRVPPEAEHEHAGAWVYQDGAEWKLRDGSSVDVAGIDLRRIEAGEVTFERAPKSPLLRKGVMFDWDSDGLLADEPIGWIDWAGHCDLKAIQEAVGLTMTSQPLPSVHEHRTDTGETHLFDRDRLLEVLTAIMEFGSIYQPFDGSSTVSKGVTHFGGARNDALPDRLQFQGPGAGRSFRWPLERQAGAMVTTGLVDSAAKAVPLDTAFQRWLPDGDALTLASNPLYKTTVEGDYNVIDVSGHTVSVRARIHGFDAKTGAYTRTHEVLKIDLAKTEGRTMLGTHLHNAAERALYTVWLDHEQPAIVAELARWQPDGDGWVPVAVPEKHVVMPMLSPLKVTLSREQRLDDPAAYQALLQAALRRGEGIVADTDEDSPVWNGVVTRLDVEREALDRKTQIERWNVKIKARFGKAALRWLVRRDADGTPLAYAPLADANASAADFLWQDFPDVGSKARDRGTWVVNKAMVSRGVVELRQDDTVDGGVYVHDEHIKNLAELLWCGLAGQRYTIVHNNKRYSFADEGSWNAAIAQAERARSELSAIRAERS